MPGPFSHVDAEVLVFLCGRRAHSRYRVAELNPSSLFSLLPRIGLFVSDKFSICLPIDCWWTFSRKESLEPMVMRGDNTLLASGFDGRMGRPSSTIYWVLPVSSELLYLLRCLSLFLSRDAGCNCVACARSDPLRSPF